MGAHRAPTPRRSRSAPPPVRYFGAGRSATTTRSTPTPLRPRAGPRRGDRAADADLRDQPVRQPARATHDGYAGHAWDLDIPGTRQVRGGNSYTFHRRIRPEDVVTATWRIDRRRPSKVTGSGSDDAGRHLAARRTRTSDGELLAENEETIIYVGAGEALMTPPPSVTACPRSSAPSTLPDMVAYAGATWDWHRLHYDPAFVAGARAARPGRRRPGVRRAARRAAAGLARAAVRSCASCRSASRTWSSPARRCAASGTVTEVDDDRVVGRPDAWSSSPRTGPASRPRPRRARRRTARTADGPGAS